jgi:hypothetical protein
MLQKICILFPWQQDILEAFDEATKKYLEETAKGERSDAAITAMMKAFVKAKVASYKGKFSKYTTLAIPRLGDNFLDEV